MQGERNSAGAAEAKLHVTFVVLLLVVAFTASWSVQEGNRESKAKPRKQRTTHQASVAILSLPAASSYQPSHTIALSPSTLHSLPHHGATTATSCQGQQEAFDILWKLLKIDALHRAQEVSSVKGDKAESMSGARSQVGALPRSPRVEEMLDTEGRTSSLYLKRWGPPELTSDEAQEHLSVPGEEEAEETSSGRTRAIKAAGSQPRHFPSLLQVEGLWGVDRGLFVATCR